MSEYTELQNLVEQTPEPLLRKQRSGEVPCSPASESNVPPKVEHTQWVVEPNGSYSATGATVKALPPAVYRVSVDNYGNVHLVQVPTLSDTLFDLDDTASVRVINGIRTFWSSRDSFKKLGILYKRGVLLWGPAGSGKTATVYQLMRELVAGGGVVILGDYPPAIIRALEIFRMIERDRSLIVVLEDIEEMIEHHGEHDLLALLDGEHQVDNVVHIATTNFPEKLGARIVNRPSRFDEVIKIGMPTDNARSRYLEFVLGETLSGKERQRWVSDTKGLSIAHLRELVVATQCLKRPYDETIERLKGMKVSPKSNDTAAIGMTQ